MSYHLVRVSVFLLIASVCLRVYVRDWWCDFVGCSGVGHSALLKPVYSLTDLLSISFSDCLCDIILLIWRAGAGRGGAGAGVGELYVYLHGHALDGIL
jgi:hypothetical protein